MLDVSISLTRWLINAIKNAMESAYFKDNENSFLINRQITHYKPQKHSKNVYLNMPR